MCLYKIDNLLIDYIPHEDIQDMNWYKLKIKHALSKTTGLIWPRPGMPIPANMNEVMQLKFESQPGTSFMYKPDSQIIVYLLEEIYGMDIVELLKTKIISNFKSKEFLWNREDIQGMMVCVGLLDELGQLMLNKGIIYGKRLFKEEYYEQSICAYSSGGFPEGNAYGLGWWLKENGYFFASGFGGQYLAVIPQKKMIISILSDMDRPHPENKSIVEQALQF